MNAELLKAHEEATERGWHFRWERDECIGCDCGSGECPCFSKDMHESFCCVLFDEDGELLDSLGSICEPTTVYRLTIEAEMAAQNLIGATVD